MISTKLKKQGLEKVPCNLLQIALFTRQTERQKEFEKIRNLENGVIDKYFELQEEVTQDGIVQRLVECDYPITADYVKSHATSADYHNDIQSAVANGHNKQNLGDVTAIQDLLKEDLSELRNLKERFDGYLKQVEDSKTVNENNIKVGEINGESL